MTKEQIEDRLNGLLNDLVEADRDAQADESLTTVCGARQHYQETRKRVMDTLIDIYIG